MCYVLCYMQFSENVHIDKKLESNGSLGPPVSQTLMKNYLCNYTQAPKNYFKTLFSWFVNYF